MCNYSVSQIFCEIFFCQMKLKNMSLVKRRHDDGDGGGLVRRLKAAEFTKYEIAKWKAYS